MNEMFDFGSLMKIKGAWDTFTRNHPKFMPFVKAVEADGIVPGTVLEITVKSPDGKERTANIKVQQSDLDLFESLKSLC